MSTLIFFAAMIFLARGITRYSPKNNFKRSETSHVAVKWFWVFIPPLFLLPLATIPPNVITVLFWFAGTIYVLGSAISIVTTLYKYIFKSQKNHFFLIRPLLTISIFLLCVLSISISEKRAIKFARTAATEVQSKIDLGECPTSISGWSNRGEGKDGYTSETEVKTIAKYYVTYFVKNNCETFRMWVYINIDLDHVFIGGRNKTLIEEKNWN